jgi:hypothetical protein
MEVSKEIRAKIFANYLGCEYENINGNDGIVDGDCLSRLYSSPSMKLILRSLEDITDGEIKELAKIAYNKEWVSVERQKSLIQVTSADDCTLQLYFENCGISAGDEYGNTVFIDPDVLQSIAIGDKLREWGFMLPAYGIPDLFEAGVAVRKDSK